MRAPSEATRPASSLRLVIRTMAVGVAGSSGRTWAGSRALSSTISIRRPSSRLRYSACRPSSVAGRRAAGTPSASRNARSASAGGSGSAGPNPRRFTYSCPSGKSAAARRAQCTASAVLPTPAVPPIAVISTGPSGRRSSPDSARSSRARPVNPGTVAGSITGAGSRARSGSTGSAGAGTFAAGCPVAAGRLPVACLPWPAGTASGPCGASSSVRSDRRIRWFSSRSPGPGSIPICSTKCRRTCRYASSADACCPDRYNASISNSASRSRNGSAAASPRTSATTSR